MKRALSRAAILFAAIVTVAGAPAVARAAPPSNDDFANAAVVDPAALPFADSVGIDEATQEPGEPSGCFGAAKSVWYAITPTSDGLLRADISASSVYDRVVNVYRSDGTGVGGLTRLACASPYYNGQNAAAFAVEAGRTYYLQAAGLFWWSSGSLGLSVTAVLPPANDDFASATRIASIPFDGNTDATASTGESGEPGGCNGTPANSVWWTFTPAAGESLMVSTGYWDNLAVYSGTSLDSLSALGCRSYGQSFTFRADASTTYYFQVVPLDPLGNGVAPLRVAVAPPPVASFYSYPSDPSTFDTLQFYDQSYDPAGAGISSEAWRFGDGTTATGCCPRHAYATDGDYDVVLDVQTADGRTASFKRTMQVRTHDVTVAKLSVPQTARSGQTKTISVGITNTRYPETVQVQLLESIAGGGFQQVGSLTQSVPVRGPNRTTAFDINYTFSDADAAAGKVNFEVIATIVGARDAVPSDNTVIALPTTVTR